MTQPPGAWRFMGVDRSHFSGKLRPAVRYKEMYCLEVPPDMAEIRARTGVSFVPVLISPEGDWLQDTTTIIDVLEARIPDPPLIPEAPLGRLLCRLFELYADEFFPMVSMRTRWAYEENRLEMQRAFAAFSGSVEIGQAVAEQMGSYLPMLGVTEETIPAIDAHLDAMLAALCAHFRDQPFLLGDRMSLADCALMGPLYAHLYLDRVTRRKLYEEAIEVCMWIERCNRPVPAAMGAWRDDLSSTLQDVVALIGADAAPVIAALEQAFETWADGAAEPGVEPPRVVARFDSELRGAALSAGARSYVVYKLQRLREAASDDAVAALGNRALQDLIEAPARSTLLTKDGNRVVVR